MVAVTPIPCADGLVHCERTADFCTLQMPIVVGRVKFVEHIAFLLQGIPVAEPVIIGAACAQVNLADVHHGGRGNHFVVLVFIDQAADIVPNRNGVIACVAVVVLIIQGVGVHNGHTVVKRPLKHAAVGAAVGGLVPNIMPFFRVGERVRIGQIRNRNVGCIHILNFRLIVPSI